MKQAAPEQRYRQLGSVFRVIEQFELLSRTDLAKLTDLAPSSITHLTKTLIEQKLVVERAVQTLSVRGRPSVGLAVSPFHWTMLCITISRYTLQFALCRLDGEPEYQARYPLSADAEQLGSQFEEALADFQQQANMSASRLLAVSVSVMGKLNPAKNAIIQLDNCMVQVDITSPLRAYFDCPLLINEHFQLWFLAESMLGHRIRDNDVIYLQLDHEVNLSVRLKGQLLHQDEHKRMNVDKMMMPRFALSDCAFPELPPERRYQLKQQISFNALVKLIELNLPIEGADDFSTILGFCEQLEQGNKAARAILNHLTDNLAYMLMNLVNLFSIEKIMLNSPLLRIKQHLFPELQKKLNAQLLLDNLQIDLVSSQFEWDSPQIPAVAIKWGIYNGELLQSNRLAD